MKITKKTVFSDVRPADTTVEWMDTTTTPPTHKVYFNNQWMAVSSGAGNNTMLKVTSPTNNDILITDSTGQAVDSGKKVTDLMPNATNTGTAGQMLKLNASGEPEWAAAPSGTVTLDDFVSSVSTNGVENQAITNYVDDNFAKKDGYYSTLTTGAAENLVGQTVDSEAYLIRPTAGAENEVANGVASVLGMEGNSAVWNQLVNKSSWGKEDINSYGTYSINSTTGAITFNITTSPTSDVNLLSISPFFQSIPNNKLLLQLHSSSSNLGIRRAGGGNMYNDAVFTKSVGDAALFIRMKANTPTGTYTINPNIINIALLGIDNLTDPADVEAWLAQHVGTKPYYAYNAGTILSSQTLGIKTYGQNLLNPTTKQAKLIPYTWVENGTTYSNQYTIKNIPSGATATFTPDNTGVAVTVDISGGSLNITSYGSGILELSAATANTYVCMKWNTEKDNDIVPYEDPHTYDFDVRNVYGKVSGAGEYVQCFPNGMGRVGTVYDYINGKENVAFRGVYKVKLKDIQYTLDSTNLFSGVLPVGARYRGSGSENTTNILLNTNRYKTNVGYYNWVNNDYMLNIGISSPSGGSYRNPTIFIKDIECSTVQDLLSKVENIECCFEERTPHIFTDLIYRDNGIDRPLADVLMNIEVNNWSMEEQLITPYVDGNPTSIPATISTKYGMDAVEQILTLKDSCYVAKDVKDNLQALLTCINTNCSETLGGTFSIGDPTQEGSKVFTFSFTANTEPEP